MGEPKVWRIYLTNLRGPSWVIQCTEALLRESIKAPLLMCDNVVVILRGAKCTAP